jgi:hypothetical protein
MIIIIDFLIRKGEELKAPYHVSAAAAHDHNLWQFAGNLWQIAGTILSVRYSLLTLLLYPKDLSPLIKGILIYSIWIGVTALLLIYIYLN